MNKTCDIFICYRRSGGGYETATMLHDRLKQRNYKIFMDTENLGAGKFDEELYRQIDNCKDMIVIIGPNSLDRCQNEDDWVRLEIAYALKNDKNIVPVFLHDYKFPDEPFPSDIDKLRIYQGITISSEYMETFFKRLQNMLHSKRYMPGRVKKQLLFILLPVIILAGTFLFIHNYNKQKEEKQLEQVSTEILSEISGGVINGNQLIGTVQDVNVAWKKFYSNLLKTNDPNEKAKLKKELIQYVDFKLKQISDTTKIPDIKLTASNEELLAKNGISTQDIKAAKMMFITDIEQTQDYLSRIKTWINTPEMGWPGQLDEGLDKLAAMTIEMINGGIYAFNELMIEMPKNSQKVFNKFRPNMGKYTAQVDYQAAKEDLEAKQNGSKEICNELLLGYSSIVGNENIRVEKMKNKLDSLKADKKKAQIGAIHDLRIDSMKKVVAGKKQVLQQKQTELDAKKQVLKESYQRILQKCSLDKNEDPGIMWGKIIHLAQFGYAQIKTENNYKAENGRLKEEAKKNGKNPNSVGTMTAVISSKQVFQEVQKRLDLYLAYNKTNDPDAAIYAPAAKRYYQLVAVQKAAPIGVLIVATKDNQQHPLLRIGDVIVEKKGEAVNRTDTYFNLSEKAGDNVQKLIRYVNGKKTELTGTVPVDCKILVGVQNLWEEK